MLMTLEIDVDDVDLVADAPDLKPEFGPAHLEALRSPERRPVGLQNALFAVEEGQNRVRVGDRPTFLVTFHRTPASDSTALTAPWTSPDVPHPSACDPAQHGLDTSHFRCRQHPTRAEGF